MLIIRSSAALAILCFSITAYGQVPLDDLTEAVTRMCVTPTAKGDILQTEGGVTVDAPVIFRILGVEGKGELEYKKWNGIDIALDKYPSDPRKCALEILRILVPAYGKDVTEIQKRKLELAQGDRLVAAVRTGDVGELEHWLREGLDPNAIASTGNTALALAAWLGDLDMVLLLLQWEADPTLEKRPDPEDPPQNLPVMEAVNGAGGWRIDTKRAESMQEKCKIVEIVQVQLVTALLSHGASPEGDPNGTGWTPLMYVANDDNCTKLDLMNLLAQHDADVNTVRTNRFGNITALGLAVFSDAPADTIEWLLKKGADPNVRGVYGDLPLIYLAKHPGDCWLGNLRTAEIFHLLLAHGADLSLSDDEGNTVVDIFDERLPKGCKTEDCTRESRGAVICREHMLQYFDRS